MKLQRVKEHFYYDLSRIMKQAHELRRTQGCSMKMALMYAWEQAKKAAAKTIAIVNRIADIKIAQRNRRVAQITENITSVLDSYKRRLMGNYRQFAEERNKSALKILSNMPPGEVIRRFDTFNFNGKSLIEDYKKIISLITGYGESRQGVA